MTAAVNYMFAFLKGIQMVYDQEQFKVINPQAC